MRVGLKEGKTHSYPPECLSRIHAENTESSLLDTNLDIFCYILCFLRQNVPFAFIFAHFFGRFLAYFYDDSPPPISMKVSFPVVVKHAVFLKVNLTWKGFTQSFFLCARLPAASQLPVWNIQLPSMKGQVKHRKPRWLVLLRYRWACVTNHCCSGLSPVSICCCMSVSVWICVCACVCTRARLCPIVPDQRCPLSFHSPLDHCALADVLMLPLISFTVCCRARSYAHVHMRHVAPSIHRCSQNASLGSDQSLSTEASPHQMISFVWTHRP